MQVRATRRRARGIVSDPLILRLAEDHFRVSVADSDVLLRAKGIAVGRGLDVNLSAGVQAYMFTPQTVEGTWRVEQRPLDRRRASGYRLCLAFVPRSHWRQEG